MKFDWNDYYGLACDLCMGTTNASRESRLRSAVSRAYYSAYHYAVRKYLREGWQPPFGTDSHEAAFRCMEMNEDPNARTCANALRTLKKKRKTADYEAQPCDWERTADFVLMAAARILELPDSVRNAKI